MSDHDYDRELDVDDAEDAKEQLRSAMSKAEEILREKCRWTQTEIDAERYYELAEVMESYAREERPRVRKRIADCLIGNAFPETQWGKGYCAGILAALTAFDDAIDAARIREGQ